MKHDGEVSVPNLIPKKPFSVRGTAISPGLAQGVIHLQHGLLGPIDVPQNSAQHNVEKEFVRLDQATAKISDDLYILATRVEKEIDSRLAEVFGAHKQILNDQVLREELRKEIVDNLVTASSAVKSVFLRWETRFLLMESQIAREKGDDLRDISIRLRNALAGITIHPLENIPERCVLVTQRLLPSDTVFLSTRSTAAVLLEYGSQGSHAALFTRQMGVPCISGIPKILTLFSDGEVAQIDANKGAVTVNPDQKQHALFQNRVEEHAQTLCNAQHKALQPATTHDGVTIAVNANVGCHVDSCKAAQYGADGIGLYRLEQFYIGRTQPPSCDELITELRHTLAPLKGHTVSIRLLDVGADKPLPFIGFMAETNPALGRRGIRLLREYPELLHTQLKAILCVRDDFDVQIIVPMVTLAEDILPVKYTLDKLCAEFNITPPKLGAMIETPAAALSAHSIAPLVDFMSFGTNDLTQYTFAADRENAAVEAYFNDASDIIFRLISLVHSDVPNMPLAICGELAGRTKYIGQLLLSGITSLSVAAPLIPMIKEAVRNGTCSPTA